MFIYHPDLVSNKNKIDCSQPILVLPGGFMKYLAVAVLAVSLSACVTQPTQPNPSSKPEKTVQGTFTYPTGEIFSGTLVKGKPSGVGTLTAADGTVSTGIFLYELGITKVSEIIKPDHTKYIFLPPPENDPNHLVYKQTGNTEFDGKRYAKIIYPDISEYQGYIDQDLKRAGAGSFTSKRLLKITSQHWQGRDAENAVITYRFSSSLDGYSYVGNIKDMQLDDAQGECHFADGSIVRGDIKSTHPLDELDLVYHPIDYRTGKYTYIREAGHHGFKLDDKAVCYGNSLRVDPVVDWQAGIYKDGKQHGPFTSFFLGYLTFGQKENGIKVGEFRSMNFPKKTREYRTFVNDKAEGFARIYRVSDSRKHLAGMTEYKDGKPINVYRFLREEYLNPEASLQDVDEFSLYYFFTYGAHAPFDTFYVSKDFAESKSGYLITKDQSHLIINAKLKNNGSTFIGGQIIKLKAGAGYEGQFTATGFKAQQFDEKGQLLYSGDYSQSGSRQGDGFCRYGDTMEPCRYLFGDRVDDLYVLREQATQEQARQQACESAWDDIQRAEQNLMHRLNNLCDREVESAISAMEHYADDMECESCGRSDANYMLEQLSSCVGGISAGGARSSISQAERTIEKNQCDGRNQLLSMRSSREFLWVSFEETERNARHQLNQIRQQKEEISDAKQEIAEAEEARRNQEFLDNISRPASEQFAYFEEQQRQVQSLARSLMEQQQEQKRARERENASKIERYQSQQRSFTNPYKGNNVKRQDPFAKARENCSGPNKTWHERRKTCVVVVPRAPVVDTSVTVADNSTAVKPANNSDGNSERSKAESEMGPIQPEALALCWNSSNGEDWFCDGPTQKLQATDKSLDKARGYVGCHDGGDERSHPYPSKPNGRIYYCRKGMETYDRDIASIYSLSRSALSERLQYQCRENYVGICRDLMR